MKNLKTYNEFLNENLNEGTYADLSSWLDEVLQVVKKNNPKYDLKYHQSIMLDVVGGFGFKTETVVINIPALAKDINTPEDFAKNIIMTSFDKYKTKLKKGTTRNGDTYITYKK